MREQMMADHRSLRSIAADLEILVERDDPPPRDQLARQRWALQRELTRHLAIEDRHVYPAMEGGPCRELAALARRIRDELGDLLERFNRHMLDWNGDSIERDWAGYRASALGLLGCLERRIAYEDAELYPRFAA